MISSSARRATGCTPTVDVDVTVSYDFAGTTAIVTGGARGIGRAVAGRLTGSGSDVWVLDIDPIGQSGVRSRAADVRSSTEVASFVEEVVSESGPVDVLVNSAGHLGGYMPFERLPPPDWRQILDVNLVGVLEISRQVVPHMRRARTGRIVNLGSLAGKQGLANLAVYSAASAGVIAFTKALAQELAGTGVRVNCVTPGPIDTTLITNLGSTVVEEMIERSPLRRLGTVDEVAELVVWLCSDACSFSTGAVFDVSGGRATY